MKNVIYVLLTSIIMLSCDKAVQKPDEVISRNEMVEILTENYLLNNMRPTSGPVGNSNVVNQQAYILQNRGYDWETFKENYTYYMLDEKNAKYITDKVRDNLNKLVPEKEEKVTPQKSGQKRKDSLKPNFENRKEQLENSQKVILTPSQKDSLLKRKE